MRDFPPVTVQTDLAADLVGVGVIEFGEDVQGLLPGVVGCVGVVRGVVGVAEAVEDVCF